MSGDSQTLENTSSNVIVHQDASGEILEVGDEGLERWCSKALIYRSSVRAVHFSGGAGGGAHAT